MRKSKMVLLATALAVAVSAPAISADRAGIGLNWGIGPTIAMGPFDMKFQNGFDLGWKVSDYFSVAVIREEGLVRGQKEYATNLANTIKTRIVVEGTSNVTGLRFTTNLNLPIFNIGVGLDVGTQVINAATLTYSHSDGSAGAAAADWGTVAPTGLVVTAPVLGLVLKWKVLEFETKTITSTIDVTGAVRWVSFNDTAVFGNQESVTAVVPRKKIDPVGNYNNVALKIGIGLWF